MLTKEQISAKSGRQIVKVCLPGENDCVYVRSLIVEDFLNLSTIQEEQGKDQYTDELIRMSLCNEDGTLIYEEEPLHVNQWPVSLFMPIIGAINTLNGLDSGESEKN